MTGFNDSVSNIYTTDGNTPKSTEQFIVRANQINNVPVIFSTNNTNFITGILWDKTKDTDGKFGQEDKEDLVFASKINKNTQGKYGTYDYEIKIPVRLREYDKTDNIQVYLYYELN